MCDLGRTDVVGGWHSVFWVVWLVLVGVVASFLFVVWVLPIGRFSCRRFWGFYLMLVVLVGDGLVAVVDFGAFCAYYLRVGYVSCGVVMVCC